LFGRFLVGEKLSQDPEFLKLAADVAQQIAIASIVASLFPKFLKSTAVKYLTRFNEATSHVTQKILAQIDAVAGQPHEDVGDLSALLGGIVVDGE